LGKSFGFVTDDFNDQAGEDEESLARKLLLKEEEQNKQEMYQLT
jgi:hypothetical protein